MQGPGWAAPDFAASWQDETRREAILRIAGIMEREPMLSPHIMVVARKGD